MKRNQKLKLTKKALIEYPEYRGAVLRFIREVKLNGASYLGYRVKVSRQKPFKEDWDSCWFEPDTLPKEMR